MYPFFMIRNTLLYFCYRLQTGGLNTGEGFKKYDRGLKQGQGPKLSVDSFYQVLSGPSKGQPRQKSLEKSRIFRLGLPLDFFSRGQINHALEG